MTNSTHATCLHSGFSVECTEYRITPDYRLILLFLLGVSSYDLHGDSLRADLWASRYCNTSHPLMQRQYHTVSVWLAPRNLHSSCCSSGLSDHYLSCSFMCSRFISSTLYTHWATCVTVSSPSGDRWLSHSRNNPPPACFYVNIKHIVTSRQFLCKFTGRLTLDLIILLSFHVSVPQNLLRSARLTFSDWHAKIRSAVGTGAGGALFDHLIL